MDKPAAGEICPAAAFPLISVCATAVVESEMNGMRNVIRKGIRHELSCA